MPVGYNIYIIVNLPLFVQLKVTHLWLSKIKMPLMAVLIITKKKMVVMVMEIAFGSIKSWQRLRIKNNEEK